MINARDIDKLFKGGSLAKGFRGLLLAAIGILFVIFIGGIVLGVLLAKVW